MFGFRFGARDACPVEGFELGDAGRVIGVMVGNENVVEPPAALRQGRFNGSRIRRVDRRCFTRRRVMQQNAVVVRKARNKNDVEGSMGRLWSASNPLSNATKRRSKPRCGGLFCRSRPRSSREGADKPTTRAK